VLFVEVGTEKIQKFVMTEIELMELDVQLTAFLFYQNGLAQVVRHYLTIHVNQRKWMDG